MRRYVGNASRSKRNTQVRRDEAHENRPLRRILDNIEAKSIPLTAGDRSVKGKRSHPPHKEDEWLLLEIPNPQRAFRSKNVRYREII